MYLLAKLKVCIDINITQLSFSFGGPIRDAVVINIVSFCTSLYAGLAVFSIIGYMANEYNLDVKEVIDSGRGSGDFFVFTFLYKMLNEHFHHGVCIES